MPLAWEGRAKCDSDKELDESSDPPQASFRKNVFQSSQDDDQHIHPEEAKSNVKGRVAGGSYLEEARNAYEENGPLLEVDMDLPLTFTKLEHDKGEFIVLAFAPEDKENPFNRSKRKKMFVSSLLCLMTLFIGLATTAYSSGIGLMTEEFGVSQTLGQLGLFTFNFVCAISPLFLAPFCELVGRNWIYIGSYGSFIIMFVGLALGRNTATIVVCRGLLGLFGCVGTILVGGTFSDIYVTEKRAVPMALFSYSAILGTVAAPIYSGFIDQALGWRWTQGIQGLSNIPLFVAILFCFPETRGGAVLKTRAKAIRKATGDERYKARMEVETRDIKAMLHASSVKAVHMLVTQPVVFAFGLWIAFAWFVTFLFLSVITITFQEKRGWSLDIGGSAHSCPSIAHDMR